MLSELAFSGRHLNCSLWILTQKYNSILTDVREQIKWMALSYCKDRDSFEKALRENDVIPSLEERKEMRDLIETLRFLTFRFTHTQTSALASNRSCRQKHKRVHYKIMEIEAKTILNVKTLLMFVYPSAFISMSLLIILHFTEA